MKIEKNSVVSFHYRLSNSKGEEIENSRNADPMTYLHGHKGIIAGLELEMAGREAGESFSATIAPEMAYGSRRDDAIQRIQMKAVTTRGKLKPGMIISVNTEKGPRQVQVIKAGRTVVDVDNNHPLAGETVTFEVEVAEVRESTPEERTHGHAHGPGGHNH
jgi:FKBP-type peptidyl-prolyl cis-trans isomerase SlyD